MNNISTHTKKQSSFDTVLVLAKAESRGEYCVVYAKDKIRNLNFLEQIKNRISNLFGRKHILDTNTALKFQSAKTHVADKLGQIIYSEINIDPRDHYNLPINQSYFKSEIAYNFLDKRILKSKEEINTSSISLTPEDQKKLDDKTKACLEHLPELINAALNDPSLEKYISLLVKDDDPEKINTRGNITQKNIDAEEIITMAKQAKQIKESLHCSPEKSVTYLNILAGTKTINQDSDKKRYIDKREAYDNENNPHLSEKDKEKNRNNAGKYFEKKSLEKRIENFISVKKEFYIDAKFAALYAKLMGHETIITKYVNSKEAIKLVDQFISKSNIENIAESDIESEFNKFITQYESKKEISKFMQFLTKDEILLLPGTERYKEFEKIATEMANPAYSTIPDKEYIKSSAIDFLKQKKSAYEERITFDETSSRQAIAAKFLASYNKFNHDENVKREEKTLRDGGYYGGNYY